MPKLNHNVQLRSLSRSSKRSIKIDQAPGVIHRLCDLSKKIRNYWSGLVPECVYGMYFLKIDDRFGGTANAFLLINCYPVFLDQYSFEKLTQSTLLLPSILHLICLWESQSTLKIDILTRVSHLRSIIHPAGRLVG